MACSVVAPSRGRRCGLGGRSGSRTLSRWPPSWWPDPEQVADLDEEPDDRKVRKALRSQERDSFRTPALETLDRPAWSPLRVAGMVALRGYLLVAVVLVGVKVAEAISG